MIISDKHILSLQKKTWNSFISLGNHRNISSKVENLCYMWCTSHQTEKSPLKTILMCRINCPFTILSTLGLNIKASQSVRSVTQLCPTRCDPMDWSTPGLLVHHQLPELAQTHVHQVGDAIQPSHPLCIPFSSYLQSFSASGSFPMSWLLALGGQSIGVSASASVRPMNIQDWFPLGLFFNESHFAREESWLKRSAIIMNYFWYAT